MPPPADDDEAIEPSATSSTTEAQAERDIERVPERRPPERRPPERRAPEHRYEPEPETEADRATPSISQAIEQVTKIVEDLKRVLEEMEEVLETLEYAERQKIDDERELESLGRALRQLRRPSQLNRPEERERR